MLGLPASAGAPALAEIGGRATSATLVTKTCKYGIFVAKICKYGIFVAKIYKYAFNDSFLRFSGSLDSAASLAALLVEQIFYR